LVHHLCGYLIDKTRRSASRRCISFANQIVDSIVHREVAANVGEGVKKKLHEEELSQGSTKHF
jgi:rRNA maturation protein Rpf1